MASASAQFKTPKNCQSTKFWLLQKVSYTINFDTDKWQTCELTTPDL